MFSFKEIYRYSPMAIKEKNTFKKVITSKNFSKKKKSNPLVNITIQN